jgi:hypothetical protein
MALQTVQKVEPYTECLLQPLHDIRQLEPVLRLDIKIKPFVLQAESPDFKNETLRHFVQNLGEQRKRLPRLKQGFPPVYGRADFVPHAISKFS